MRSTCKMMCKIKSRSSWHQPAISCVPVDVTHSVDVVQNKQFEGAKKGQRMGTKLRIL